MSGVPVPTEVGPLVTTCRCAVVAPQFVSMRRTAAASRSLNKADSQHTVDPIDRSRGRADIRRQHVGAHAERLAGHHQRGSPNGSRATRVASSRLTPSARSSTRAIFGRCRRSRAARSSRRMSPLAACIGRKLAAASAVTSRLVRISRRSSVLASKNNSIRSSPCGVAAAARQRQACQLAQNQLGGAGVGRQSGGDGAAGEGVDRVDQAQRQLDVLGFFLGGCGWASGRTSP